MLSFAAIVPHPAVLIPGMEKEKAKKLAATEKALEVLEYKLTGAGVETLIIISSHSKMHLETLSILFAPEYKTDFREFGNVSAKASFYPDLQIVEKIRHSAIDRGIPFTLTHGEFLDHSFSVPLLYLNKNKKIKIVPFVHSHLGLKEHFEAGQLLNKIAQESNKKIGVIASGHLSHRSSEASPAGYSPKGKIFNEKIKEFIENKNAAGLLSLDAGLIKEAEECITEPLAAIFGALDKSNYEPEILSFEAPFGIGHMVCNFNFG